MQILICEDERRLASALKQILEEEKYRADVVYNGTDALDYGKSGIYDVIIMDVMMPCMSGLEAVRGLRQAGIETPVLMLTARSSTADKVSGLDMGANDYITKPFAIEELLARIRVVLRSAEGPQARRTPDVLRCGELLLDPARPTVTYGGEAVNLTFKEFLLLQTLLENRDIVLSRDTLLERVWGYDYLGETRTIDVHIRNLRKKIEEDPDNPVHIKTVRGIGYKFV